VGSTTHQQIDLRRAFAQMLVLGIMQSTSTDQLAMQICVAVFVAGLH
jgi:hypothetical protein